ncbi:MAG: PilZ domain-containing protein [Acidobacteria bacterium]|nr:PilZ domain-containing protein [Acidobacteriota bacterium]
MVNGESSTTERRRAVRYAVDGSEPVGFVASNSVRVVDISAGGVLLVSSRPASVGTRGRLTLNLGGNPLAAEIEIRRVVTSPDRSFRIGAMFVGISPLQQDAIERFARPGERQEYA